MMPDAPQRLSPPVASLPRATYRLQFHKGFPFSAGRDLAPYLEGLGVSHVYSSPILTARAGSLHGYDVVDYEAINPELGGEAAFREMAAALRSHGIGIILDIVPNHMAVGAADNRLWLDLLQNGRESAYATWFDVDFDGPDPALRGKVHAPFLGEPYEAVLASGGLELVARDHAGSYAIAYGEHLFPIRPQDEAGIDAAGVDAFRDPAKLDELIARQNFVLDWWRNAGDRINWRRFFDVTQLAAVRMEEPAAFEAAHAIALKLYGEGLVDGLRVDHVDGLADPAGYCRQLRQRLDGLAAGRPPGAAPGRAWLLVEKILAAGEALPACWDVDGTTGYDFMDQVSALQHDDAARGPFEDAWARLSGRSGSFEPEESMARHEILSNSFDGQRERLVDGLVGLASQDEATVSITRAALRRAVTALIAHIRVYRSYATGWDDGVAAGAPFAAALAAASSEVAADPFALRFIASVMAGEGAAEARAERVVAIRRFNQLSAPLAAKAVEDTAFYRYGRLLSRNDVGFDAAVMGIDAAAFHALMAERADAAPHAMLATATHDHKRGEDLRARLAVLSEIPERWIAATRRWSELNAAIRPEGFGPGDEYMLYQMLVGAWPHGLGVADDAGLAELTERLGGWWQKALREAKLRSGWAAPNEAYEQQAARFLELALMPSRSAAFLADLAGFVDDIARPGALNGLAQLVLRCTVPGVPDTYQGCEYWDFSLVDPDNRRPVDFSSRRIALAQHLTLDLLAGTWRDGRVKQALLRKLLGLRLSEPALFADGGYEPLAVTGERSGSVLAFLRRHESRAALVVVGRLCADGLAGSDGLAPATAWWGDTRIAPPGGFSRAQAVIGPELALSDALAPGDLLPIVPVGVWVLDAG